MRIRDKARRADEAKAAFALILQTYEDHQAEKLGRLILDPISDASDLDEREEANVRNLQAATPSQRSSSIVFKRGRLPLSLLTSRSSSIKRRKTQAAQAEQCSSQAVQPGGPGGARPNAKYSVVYSRIGIGRACGAPNRILSISFISLKP
jgi:hypothetical protein